MFKNLIIVYTVQCTLQYVCLLLLTFCVIKISLSPCEEERGGRKKFQWVAGVSLMPVKATLVAPRWPKMVPFSLALLSLAVALLSLGSSQGCGITTHTEIGQRALHMLGTHANPATEAIRSTVCTVNYRGGRFFTTQVTFEIAMLNLLYLLFILSTSSSF